MEDAMKVKKLLFRTSYAFAMAGGLIAVAGGWLLGRPSTGANIGAGLLIMGASVLMSVAVVTCIISWIICLSQKQEQSSNLSSKRA